ncbi:MAG TPA: bacteriohemerythrin [Azonexus sp.]|nr:bacteriohemerythrin [Azonexus sp.]
MKAGPELLQWSDTFATGVDRIDRQHRMLLNILNDANHCFRHGGNAEAQARALEDLIGYTIYHFDSEEELMESGSYGDRWPDDERNHVREHRAFAKAAAEYQLAIKQGGSIDYARLFGFLNNWLLNHVMGTDQKLGAFLNSGG